MAIKVFSWIFIILLFFTWGCYGLYAVDSDIPFLRGLIDRNLFESVEVFCNGEFQKSKISATEKNILATELVRSQTRQMLLAEPKRRVEIRNRLAELETRFLGAPDEFTNLELSFTRIILQFQFAITEYSLGDWQRLEADVGLKTVKNEKTQQARTTLFNALERFKYCTEQLEILRQKAGINVDPIFEHRCLALLRTIRFQAGLAQKSLALSFPSGDDRAFGLNQTVEILTELASLPIDDPIVIQSRIELATSYRLLGNLEKCKDSFVGLQNAQQKNSLTPELQFQTEAELIRYLLAAGIIDEAAKKAEVERPDSVIYPDYDLAKLEVLLALCHRIKEQTEQRTEINRVVLDLVRKINLQSGAYWGRRAIMVLGASYLAETDGLDAPLLKMLAEYQFQIERFTEAVRFFELASQCAEAAGDMDGAFNNAVSAIAVLGNILERLETVSDESTVSTEIMSCRQQMIVSLLNITKRFPKQPEAAELHLKAIDLTTQMVLKKENSLGMYLALLKEHAELWSDSVKVPPLLLRAAMLLESQTQPTEALAMLEKIPNHSAVGLDAVNAAQRCFSTETDNLKAAKWFEWRLPADNKTAWNEADVVSAMFAAEYRIRAFSVILDAEIPKKAEQLLRSALERFPELKPITKVQIQAMLVTVLNDQGRKEDGAAFLQTLNDDQIGSLSEGEKLAFRRVQIKLLANTGKPQDAVDHLVILLKQYPDDISLLELLAEILFRQNDLKTLKRAVEIWSYIVTKSTKNTEIWWTANERIIEIYLKQNKTVEAKEKFEVLRLLYPDLGGEPRKSRLESQFNH